MKHTMRRTLALVMTLMLALPTFVFADDASVELEANGQATINGLALEEDPVLDGDMALTLDGLSLDLDGLQTPTEGQGQAEQPSEGGEVSVEGVEGGTVEQPGASEDGAPEETPVELEDGARAMDESIPEAQPLMPPDYAVDAALEGENVTDPALAANDDASTCVVSTWKELSENWWKSNVTEITLGANCEKSPADNDKLLRNTFQPLTLNLKNYTIWRKDLDQSASEQLGYVIDTQGDLTINGPGTIKGGNNANGGGGIIVGHSDCIAVMNDGTITDNKSSGNSDLVGGGVGGGVDIESGSFTMTGGTIKDNSAVNNGNGGGVYINDGSQDSGSFTMTGGAIKGNFADGNGGGVYIKFESKVPGSFTMTGGAIKGNSANGKGGGVYVDGPFSVGETNKTSTIQISGNKSGQDDNNVYLTNGKLINVNGKLSEQSDIGVTTEKVPDDNNGFIPITNSFPGNFLPDVSVFKSDDTQYAVGVTEENGGNITLGLGCKIVHTSVGADVVYDGQPHGIKVNVTKPDSTKTEIEYKVGESGQYKTENPTFTKKGSYDVYYKVSYKAPSGEQSYYFPAEGKQTVTITPNDVTLDWKAEASYTYNGQGQGPDAKIASGKVGQDDVSVTVKYKVKGADDSTLTEKKPVDVGDYVAVAELSGADKDNYNLPSNTTKEFSIKSAGMTVLAKGYKGLYDGKAHGITVIVTAPASGYAVKYGTAEGTYDSDSLTYTDAGNYTVYYQVTAKNYVTATGSATVEITAKAQDNLIITLSQTEYTYDGTAKEPAVTVTDKDTSQVVPASEYEVAYRDNVNAGTAKVTLTDVAGGNYIVNGEQTFTINTAAMTVVAEGYKGVYDGKAHGITVTVTDPEKGRTVKYGEKEGTYNRDSLTYTDAGVYTVYYQVTAKNYETVTGSATVEITAKELDNDRDGDGIEDADSNVIITLEPAEYTYDGKAKKPLVTVTDKDTGLEVPLWEFRLYFSNNVDIGTAKVTISDAEGGNYTVKGVKTFAIKGKPMTVAAKGYEGKYDGEAHGITVNVLEPSTGYTVKYGTVEGTYDKDSLTYTDAGVYTVYYQVTAEHYETVTGSATVEITANEKTSMTVVAEDYKGEYDGKAHGIKVTVTDPKTGYTVKYSTVDGTYDKDSLTYTDTGVYTVYYQVTAKNYETVTGSATVEITARVPTDLTIDLSAKTYYYYAKARKPTVTVKDGDTVVPESEYRVTYKNNIHAGTATVKITSFTKGNYRFEEERNFTIKPRNVHLKYTKLTFTYDGKYHLPLAKAIGVYPADENKYNVIMTGSGRNVGRYIARTTGIDNPDYHMLDVGEETRVIFYINPRGGRGSGSSGSGNARFVAEKKIGTEGIGTVTYDGKAQEPKFVVKCVFNDSNGVASNTVLTVPASEYKVTYSNNVDVGKATVKVTDVPGGNFIVDFNTEFTIARRKATVTANDQRVKTIDGVKTGVKAVKMKGLAKGHTLESVKLDVDIKTGAKKGEIIPVRAKIVDAKGNDVTKNYSISYKAGQLTVTDPEPDPDPLPEKPDFTLLAQMKTCGDQALRIAWTRVPGAKGYEVTFVKEDCSFSKAKVFSFYNSNSCKFTDLKKNTAYKAYVWAWKLEGNKRVYIGKKSPVVCAFTGDVRKHKTNAGSVRVNASRLSLKVGGKATIRAAVSGVRAGKDVMRWEHALLRWYSDNANVATVNAKGEVKAVAAGECTVYALAANGVRAAVKVKVKK